MKSSEKLIKISFFIALIIIIFSGAKAYKTTTDFAKSSSLLLHTYRVNVELEQILSYLKDAETGHRGYIVTADSLYLEPYLTSRDQINNSFAELKELTKDNNFQQKNLRELNVLINQRLSNFEKTSRFVLKNDLQSTDFKTIFLEGKTIMDFIRTKIAEMVEYENNLLEERENSFISSLSLAPNFLLALIVISIILILLSYIQISNDVKTLKRKNEELEVFKKSAKQSEIVSRHGSWIWNIKKNTFQYSDNLYRLLGEEPQSFEPTIENFMKYVHPEDLEELQNEVNKMLVEENLPFIHYRIIQKNGQIKYLKAYGQAINLDEEKQVIGTTTDVTDEIESFKILQERNLELIRNNEELSAFNHVASHDLQEPLRKIQTFLSRLIEKESHNLSETGKTYIDKIENASSRMRSLINDLLQFSRTNKAEKVLKLSDINEIFENSLQDLAEVIEESNAKIKADNFPKIKVIPFQMQQLFSNLIGNSIKYQKENSVPEIEITYKKINSKQDNRLSEENFSKYHKFTFIDNGIGFDNEYAEKIFILFNRLHNKNNFSGTGIGLSICKKIIENHRGYIFAKGKKGVGATFEVFIPA